MFYRPYDYKECQIYPFLNPFQYFIKLKENLILPIFIHSDCNSKIIFFIHLMNDKFDSISTDFNLKLNYQNGISYFSFFIVQRDISDNSNR